jgi:hypothetical protein
MSELPSHGTGWTETEALMDIITLFNEDQDSTPDFSAAQRRLRDSFTTTELSALDTVVTVLLQLVKFELAQRS